MLSSLINPVDSMIHRFDENHFFNYIFDNSQPFNGFTGGGLALISLGSDICDPVRKALRNLNTHFKNIHLYDLGYVKDVNNENIDEIISICYMAGVVPVITGYTINHDSIKNQNGDVYIVSNKIHEGMIECNFIAYQRHLCKSEDIFIAEEYRYDTISLGKMRSNPNIIEPALRSAVHFYADLKGLRSADAPNIKNTYPTGLYAEEFCQILKYAGTGSQITSVSFQADLKSELCSHEANLIAESIWYFAEGLNISMNDHPEKSTDLTKFIIHASSVDTDIEFLKHNQTDKWWIKHPTFRDKNQYLACSYEEYQSSIGDELPERVYKYINNTL